MSYVTEGGFEAKADGPDVVIRCTADQAESIAWALRRHASQSCGNRSYLQMALDLEEAIPEAVSNGAAMGPCLRLMVAPR